jgi:hypothetical protein
MARIDARDGTRFEARLANVDTALHADTSVEWNEKRSTDPSGGESMHHSVVTYTGPLFPSVTITTAKPTS